ncbi:hypothetical protein DUD61_003297 [Geotrichum candidum]|nr:hypothetical protein DUD61_003297 [Geotrichum candidum]
MLGNNESTDQTRKGKGNNSGSSSSARQRFGGPYRHFQRRRATVYHASSRSLSHTYPIFLRGLSRARAAKRHRRALIQWLRRQKRELEARRPAHQAGDEGQEAAGPGGSKTGHGDGNSENHDAEQEEEEEEEGGGGEESDNNDSADKDEGDDYENEAQALDNALFEVQRAIDINKYSVPERGVQGTMDPDTWAVRMNGYADMGDQSAPQRWHRESADDFLASTRRVKSGSGVRVEPVPVVPAETLNLPDEGLLKSLNVYAMELLGGAVAAEQYEGRFDETALLALGIVVEEHVGELLGPTGHRVYSEYAQDSGNEAAPAPADGESDQENGHASDPEVESWGKPLMYDGRRSKEAKRKDYLTCLKTEDEQSMGDAADDDSGDESGNYHTDPESEPDDVVGIDAAHSFNLSGQKYKPAAARRRPLGVTDLDAPDRFKVRQRRVVSRDIIENLF